MSLVATTRSLITRVLSDPRLRQFLTFATVGVAATAVHYGVLILLVERGGLVPTVATTLGFVCGAFVSYTLNRRLTFATRPALASSMAKFLAFGAVGAAMNAAIVAALSAIHLHYLLAQAIATIIVLFWNYYSAKRFVFND